MIDAFRFLCSIIFLQICFFCMFLFFEFLRYIEERQFLRNTRFEEMEVHLVHEIDIDSVIIFSDISLLFI